MLVTPFTDDYKLNDDALRQEVKWALDRGAEGVVGLSGVLRNKDDRDAAIRLARSVPGVTAVLHRVNVPWTSQ